MDKIGAALTPETQTDTDCKTGATSTNHHECGPMVLSAEAELNLPNNTSEVGHIVYIKEEFTRSDEFPDFGNESGSFVSQYVKTEDEAIFSDGCNSEEPFNSNSSSTPINFLTRIKIEDDYVDQPLHSLLETNDEFPSQPSNMEIDSEIPGSAADDNCNLCSDSASYATERRSPLNLLFAKKTGKGREDDDMVNQPLTSNDLENEIPPNLSVCGNKSKCEELEHSLANDNHSINSLPILTTELIRIRTTQNHSPQQSKKRCKPEVDNLSNNASSQNASPHIDSLTPRKIDEGGTEIFPSSHCHASLLVTADHPKQHTCSITAGEKPFSCSHCSASFTQRSDLNRHSRTHTGEKPFRCSHCSASFTLKGNLKQHLLTHTGEKPFSCSHCSACFTQNSSLHRHLLTHNGEKPFSCSHCSASFTQKGSLKQHLVTHTGEKPFRCSYCSASFTQKGSLKEHLRTHTGEKPFSCSHCSASFTQKSHLKYHLRTHSGEKPFRCSHCSASFTQKSHLKEHLRTHTGEKPFSCSHCSASFTQKSHLKKHLQTLKTAV